MEKSFSFFHSNRAKRDFCVEHHLNVLRKRKGERKRKKKSFYCKESFERRGKSRKEEPSAIESTKLGEPFFTFLDDKFDFQFHSLEYEKSLFSIPGERGSPQKGGITHKHKTLPFESKLKGFRNQRNKKRNFHKKRSKNFHFEERRTSDYLKGGQSKDGPFKIESGGDLHSLHLIGEVDNCLGSKSLHRTMERVFAGIDKIRSLILTQDIVRVPPNFSRGNPLPSLGKDSLFPYPNDPFMRQPFVF